MSYASSIRTALITILILMVVVYVTVLLEYTDQFDV